MSMSILFYNYTTICATNFLLVGFQSFPIMILQSVAMNSLVHVSLYIYFSGFILSNGVAGSWDYAYFQQY